MDASRVRRRFASAHRHLAPQQGDTAIAADDARINDRIRARQVLLIGADGHQFGGTCTNAAGLVGHAAGVTIKLDKTAPATQLSVTGGTAGDNGW